MIINVYYIAFDLEEIDKKYETFKAIYKKSHSVGISIRKDLLYVACKTKEKRSEDYAVWKKEFESAVLVFKEGVTKESCLAEEGKLKKE